MPNVSILIPAYRPDFFDACIASALAQTHRDFEIIVSDDCPTEDIAQLMAKWVDPRIRYVRNPTPRRYATNRDNLVRLARGKYLKFLFDDDILYPRSVELLLHALESTGAKAAFHHRHLIDTVGRVLCSPTTVPEGTVSLVAPEAIYTRMIAHMSNPIGEPSNMMVSAKALQAIDAPFEVEGRPSRYLADVALLYNFARANLAIVGVGAFGSAFRQHPNQNSSLHTPGFAAGIFEWELLARSARAAGLLTADAYAHARQLWHKQYRLYLDRQPIFARFLVIEPDDASASALSKRFLRTLDLAYFEMEVRRVGPLVRPELVGA